MYVPKHFAEDDAEKLATLIEENSFGVLITVAEGRPFASHIPFLYEREANVLRGHVARANPQWQHFSGGSEVMVVFQGPHAYVSPSWYLSPGVPTWNYAVAHVYGSAQALEDPSRVKTIVEALTEKHERHNDPPWVPAYDPRMLNVIVGIEVAIREVQGKFKLSQNRSAADRAAVISKFEANGPEQNLALATLMKEAFEPPAQ
jgi:transcriptional regulator